MHHMYRAYTTHIEYQESSIGHHSRHCINTSICYTSIDTVLQTTNIEIGYVGN